MSGSAVLPPWQAGRMARSYRRDAHGRFAGGPATSGRNFSLFHAYPKPPPGVFGRAAVRAHRSGSLSFLQRTRMHHRAKMRRSYGKAFSRRGMPYM